MADSVDELMAAVQKAGAKDWPRSRVIYIVAMLDKSKDQKLNLEEFKRCWRTSSVGMQDELQSAYRTIESMQSEIDSLGVVRGSIRGRGTAHAVRRRAERGRVGGRWPS